MFATTVPGLGPILADEVDAATGMAAADAGSDGRADIVLFDADPGQVKRVHDLDVAEDVFVEVGRTLRADGDDPRWIARRIWRPERVARALAARAGAAGPVRAATTFRVIVRVLQERSFLRTDLRRELTRTIGADQTRWRMADPAQLEVWIVEYCPGRFVAGLRVSDVRMRQHQGRAVERAGALRPVVASGMVRQAGRPGRVLLDPCCGGGTILVEAARLGWPVRGIDIDHDAVQAARSNLRDGAVDIGDARHLPLAEASVDACVSNLPFGQQYTVDGDMAMWQREVLGELARVTRPGGRVVLLVPNLPRRAVPAKLRQTASYRIRLLGTWTRIWCFDRTAQSPAN